MIFTELNQFVVFDLEMNGSNKIIEIGAVKVNRGQKLERFSTLVNNVPRGPEMRSYKFAAKRMGGEGGWITIQMIKSGILEPIALERFMRFVGDAPIVGHAIMDGDLQIIKSALRANDLPKWKTGGKVFDTQQIYGALHGNPNQISLKALAALYDVDLGVQQHRALADARATLSVFDAMQKRGFNPGL
jgi:DNA polymerase-3 subunit alpha (Gram-positive type)